MRASRGAKLAELAEPLVDSEITLDEARAYVAELVDAQLLVPDLGIHVTHLPLRPATFGRPFPQYTNITMTTSTGKSQYDGLQVGLNGRARRVTFGGSYTLSKRDSFWGCVGHEVWSIAS